MSADNASQPDRSADRRAPHWHAGLNQPWHAPRSVPGTYNSFEDARDALAEDMELHARSEEAWTGRHICGGESCATHGESCGRRRAEAVRAERDALLQAQGPSWSGSAAGLAYWVTECPGRPPDGAPKPGLEAAASA
jgi:hypothetical protein